MSYTIIITYEKVAIKFLDDLVLKVLMDLVGYREVKSCDHSQQKQLLHTKELYVEKYNE